MADLPSSLKQWKQLLVVEMGLVSNDEWDRAAGKYSRSGDPEADPRLFVESLSRIQRPLKNSQVPLLSEFQLDEILAGRCSSLILDSPRGRLTLSAKIGAGGSGEVFSAVLAARRGRDSLVAVKFIAFRSDEEKRRIDRECKVLCAPRPDDAAGNHLVQGMFSFNATARQCVLVMEWVPGGTLNEFIQNQLQATRRLSVKDVLLLAHGIASGLAYLHRQGLVHRDLKPANVLLRIANRTETPVPVIADLGLVKDINHLLTVHGARCGTLYYSAPECFQDSASATAVSDLYSLAAVIVFMLTGRPPKGEL
ncbi:MAG: serine/threonine protein kinase, partial [Planctomycetaceae bacterium]|nr:serine/threonine protein kinase [Planctomycetaceae bacterium]